MPPPPGPPPGMAAPPPAQMPQGPPTPSPYASYTPPGGSASPYYTPAPGYAPTTRPAATQMTILLALIASGIVIGSAFMPWFSAMGISSGSGWDLFNSARLGGGNFADLFYTTQGALFFSGLFTVVSGALLAIQALIALVPPAGPRSPVAVAILGVICFGGALINIISIFGNSFFAGISPGVGLWLWAAAALAAPILLFASPGPRR